MSTSRIPELATLSKQDKTAAWRYAYHKMLRYQWLVYLGFVICGLCIGLGFYVGDVIGAAVGGGIGGTILNQILAEKGRPYVREWIRMKNR